MTPSTTCISLIQHFESFRDTAYPDQGGIWTIGYGTIEVDGAPVTKGMTCTHEQALRWLMLKVLEFSNDVSAHVLAAYPTGILQQQFDALVSFVYNVGPDGYRSSTIAKKIRAGKIETVTERNFTAWNKVRINGILTPSDGLTRRRKSEYHLFHTGTLKFYF